MCILALKVKKSKPSLLVYSSVRGLCGYVMEYVCD